MDKRVMTNEQLISASLDVLRFPLALIVVLVHVLNVDDVGICVDGHIIGTISEGSIVSYFKYIINVFIRGVSVPIYLFISGFVFFKGIKDYTFEIYKTKITNRVHTLLIPYIIWNIFELVLIIVVNSTDISSYTASGYNGLRLNFKNIISCFWIYNGQLVESGVSAVQANVLFPLNSPLWFIRNLFCIALLSPILYYILKRWRYEALIIMFFMWVLPLSDFSPLLSQFIMVIFFFSIGAVLAIHKLDVIRIFARNYTLGWILFIGGAMLFVVLKSCAFGYVFKSMSIIGALLVAYNVAMARVANGKYTKSLFLSSSSMFIYLAHSMICMRMYKVILLLIKPHGNVSIFICLTFTYILTIITLLMIYYCMCRFFPQLAVFLTGRKLKIEKCQQ